MALYSHEVVDNGMKIEDAPEAIRKQAEFIAAYEKQFESKPQTEEEPAQVPNGIEEEIEHQERPAQAQEAPLTPDNTEDKPDEEYKKLEQKYKSLQGMFNSQGKQIQNLTAKLEETLHKLETKPEPAPVQEVKPREIKKRVTEKDREALGSDLEETITRYAQDAADTIVAQKEAEWTTKQAALEKKNQELEAQLNGIKQQTTVASEGQFISQMKNEIPHFAETDTDQDFMAWLGEEDPMSGLPRTHYLGQAVKNQDMVRAKLLYTTWQDLSGKFGEKPKAVNRQVQQQVQPTRSRAAPRLPTTTHNKIWSEQEVKQFYQVNREAIAQNDPEVMKVYNEIDRALGEGRVR